MSRVIIDDILNRQITVDTKEIAALLEELYEDSPPEIISAEEFIEWIRNY